MFSTFSAVFEALDLIEKELKSGAGGNEKERIVEVMLSLRGTMDKCVQNWLKFEERLNLIQEKYGINLPDTLPEGFLDDFTNWEESFQPKEGTQQKIPPTQKGTMHTDEQLTEIGSDHLPEEVKIKENFLKISEEQAITSFRKGLGFWDLAMLEEAVKEFEAVTRMEPNFIIGHFCLGLSSNQKGDYEKALKELKLVTALDCDPSIKALAYNTIGGIYADQGKYQWALENFKKASESEPGLVESFFNQGAVLYNLQEHNSAIEMFMKVIEITPDDWEAYFYLGKASGYLRKWDEALVYLEKAYTLNPKEPLVTFELGVIHRFLGNKNKASLYFHTTQKLVD